MAVFHYVHLRAFAHETESIPKVVAALRYVAQDPAAKFEDTHVEGSHGNKIVILDGEVKSAPAIKRLFSALGRDDPPSFDHIVRTARERVDEHLNLHFRLDKQTAAQGRLVLASDDDAITVRAKIRSFESKRAGTALEGSLRDLEAFFSALTAPSRTVGQ